MGIICEVKIKIICIIQLFKFKEYIKFSGGTSNINSFLKIYIQINFALFNIFRWLAGC